MSGRRETAGDPYGRLFTAAHQRLGMGYGALMGLPWGATRIGGFRTEAFSHHTVSLFAGSDVSVRVRTRTLNGARTHEPPIVITMRRQAVIHWAQSIIHWE
jgi:hypothetical protein